jgi:hypothetical protein
MKFDHVALEVGDLDAHIEQLVDNCSMRLLRMGKRFSTGQRIAMLGDGSGTKLELIEASGTATATLAHMAFRVDDTDREATRLEASGWRTLREPHRLESARANTALLDTGLGMNVQVITYDEDAPDDVRWTRESTEEHG